MFVFQANFLWIRTIRFGRFKLKFIEHAIGHWQFTEDSEVARRWYHSWQYVVVMLSRGDLQMCGRWFYLGIELVRKRRMIHMFRAVDCPIAQQELLLHKNTTNLCIKILDIFYSLRTSHAKRWIVKAFRYFHLNSFRFIKFCFVFNWRCHTDANTRSANAFEWRWTSMLCWMLV